MNVRNVLIFGGAGFIGSHYRSFLEDFQSTIKVISLDLKEDSKICDVRKIIDLEGDFSENDVIINLAAIHTTPGHPDHEYFETNILGAENICEFADRVGIKNIIFTSSIAPYGPSEELKEETTLPKPNSPYGISKLVAEYIHKEWAAKSEERKLLIIRPGVVFGKGENGNFTRLAAAINKGIFFYPGRRDTIKACIYVKELVYQSWNLLECQSEQVETYNFTYEPAKSIKQIAEELANVMNKKKPSLLVSTWLLKVTAKVFQMVGLGGLGIHPDRVKKLMVSTNISGRRLRETITEYKFGFEEAIKDWRNDCAGDELK